MKAESELHLGLLLTIFSALGITISVGNVFEKERQILCNKMKIFGVYNQMLRHHEKSGLIVDEEIPFHYSYWSQDSVCTFLVNHPDTTDGVVAVIQSLNMRKDKTTGKCIDFIQFRSKDGTSSDEFCGRFDALSKMNGKSGNSDTINYGNSFRTKNHKMLVHVNIGREPFPIESKKSRFEVVFTAYKNCTNQTVMDVTYRPCWPSSEFCIYEEFFNDGYINCPLAGCVDEGSCNKYVTRQLEPSIGTKLLVGTISFFVIVFLAFLLSIWGCKKHKVACFSDDFSNPSRSRQTRVIEMHDQDALPVDRREGPPSAPPIELSKDLPPKYDELFPDR